MKMLTLKILEGLLQFKVFVSLIVIKSIPKKDFELVCFSVFLVSLFLCFFCFFVSYLTKSLRGLLLLTQSTSMRRRLYKALNKEEEEGEEILRFRTDSISFWFPVFIETRTSFCFVTACCILLV